MIKLRFVAGLAAVCALVLAASAAVADVTMKETTVVKGLPMVGDVTTHSTVQVAGEKQRRETRTEMSGTLGRMMAGGNKESVDIVRLDKELLWSINPEEKSYTEMTFQELRDLMQGMGQGLEDELEDNSADEEGAGEVEMKVDVQKTGNKKKVAGYDTEEVVITIEGESEDPDSGEIQKSRWVMNLWMAKDAGDLEEINEFNKMMAEKMGFSAEATDQFASLLAGYAEGLKALSKEMGEMDGVPLETHVQIEAEGEEIASDNGGGLDLGDQGGVAGALGKKMFGGKKEKKEEKPGKPRATAEGFHVVMHTVTVVEEISTSGVGGSSFEVPEGYKKVETPH